MRLQRCILACGIVLVLCVGCRSHRTPPAVTGIHPSPFQTDMAELAFLAYVGDNLTGPYPTVEHELHRCMKSALEKYAGNWSLAWGPAVYHFPITELADNMMYVVGDKEKNPSQLVIVVRGTNPDALLDWLVEDFDVVDQVSWPYAPQAPGQPKTSKGVSEGLHILKDLAPANDPENTLSQFLQNIMAASPGPVQVNLTGHSLGGALAPTLALWLYDTRSQWDPQGKASLAVYPLAGPTAGNADFASYYGSVLGKDTYRMWNPFDVVPLAWNHESMGKIADLYEPFTRANPVERGLIDGLRSLVKDKGYAQIDPTRKPLSGAVHTGKPMKHEDWMSEVGWQHHCGYECALEIAIDPSIFPNCPSSFTPCYCEEAPPSTGH